MVDTFLVGADGRGTYGDAHAYGSTPPTGTTIVGAALTPDGRGYWLASSAGRAFNEGDAAFLGDLRPLDVVGIAATVPPR